MAAAPEMTAGEPLHRPETMARPGAPQKFAKADSYRLLTSARLRSEQIHLPYGSPFMLSAVAAEPRDTGPNRRAFQRVKVNLHGRFMLQDRSEHPCQILDMSPATATLYTEAHARDGERVVAYIDHIGRVEGHVVRSFDGGFAVDLTTSPRKREKLAAQLIWLANKHELDLPEDRRHERVMPKNPASILTLADGRQYRCRIIDLSLSGAAVSIAVRPAIGTLVSLGGMRGSVVRHFDEGIAVEFAFVQRPESLSQYLG